MTWTVTRGCAADVHQSNNTHSLVTETAGSCARCSVCGHYVVQGLRCLVALIARGIKMGRVGVLALLEKRWSVTTSTVDNRDVHLPPRSLYLMTGASRYD